jgi:integrase
MSLIEDKLEQIFQDIQLIKKQLKIVPDKDGTVTNLDSSISTYEEYAREELGIGQGTINNQKSAILGFLNYSRGVINKESVKSYLDSNDSESWKSNQLKALRRYIRDFLKLGNWINEFQFSTTKAKIKIIPTDEQLTKFVQILPKQVQAIALIMFSSGLRISEVLSLRFIDIANELHMINATNIHKGKTKHSWISFMSQDAVDILYEYLDDIEFDFMENSKLFSVSARTVQEEFKKASESIEASINPHLLRTVFTEKCSQAGIENKYIDAFCGRISQGVLAKHYTDYSPNALRKQYDKVESFLSILPT